MEQWTQSGPDLTIDLNVRNRDVALSNRIVEANGRKFSLLEASVTHNGKVSFELLRTVLENVAFVGGLSGEPKTLVAITGEKQPVYVDLNYLNRNDDRTNRVAEVVYFGGGHDKYFPNLDVVLTNLTKSYNPGTVSPILVVDPSIELKPYGQNNVDDTIKKFNHNPYRGLHKFLDKKYDGSLGIPELDKFNGFMFGDGTFTYLYILNHMGNYAGWGGYTDKLFNVGEKYTANNIDWEIQGIAHERFNDSYTGIDKEFAQKRFTQNIKLSLKFLEYHPPEPI